MSQESEIEFQPLDVSYEIEGKKPKIVIWSKLRDGKNAVIEDWRFRPYFYALPVQKSEIIEKVKKDIERICNSKRISSKISIEKRKYFGKEMDVLKVEVEIPEQVRLLRDSIRSIPNIYDVLEADVRFSLRYMIDHDMKPFRWYAA
ncbi:MAG: 3'-5' exonuclease, partial [Fervidicoccaceae archaeon]